MRLLSKAVSYLAAFVSGVGVAALSAVFFIPFDEDVLIKGEYVIENYDASAQYLVEAANTVRPIENFIGQRMCSAVAIAPGKAYTAGHCVEGQNGVTVDGKRITRVTHPAMSDAAVIDVPGLECPCAIVGVPAKPGEQIVASGYAQGKALASHGPAKVVGTGPARRVYPDTPFPIHPIALALELTYAEGIILIGGMSGGGAFVYRNGHWELVATNSLTMEHNGVVASGFAPINQHEALNEQR